MSIGTALVAIKSADSTLNALIGDRFHPNVLPQGVTLPAAWFQVDDVERFHTFGPSNAVYIATVSVNGFASSAADRTTLASALRGAFGTYGKNASIGGEAIEGIVIESEDDAVEMLGSNVEAYRVRMVLRVAVQGA